MHAAYMGWIMPNPNPQAHQSFTKGLTNIMQSKPWLLSQFGVDARKMKPNKLAFKASACAKHEGQLAPQWRAPIKITMMIQKHTS